MFVKRKNFPSVTPSSLAISDSDKVDPETWMWVRLDKYYYVDEYQDG
jgi:hypothetical protein